jgi:hypothetical protein
MSAVVSCSLLTPSVSHNGAFSGSCSVAPQTHVTAKSTARMAVGGGLTKSRVAQKCREEIEGLAAQCLDVYASPGKWSYRKLTFPEIDNALVGTWKG